jgi:hypothetical protein
VDNASGGSNTYHLDADVNTTSADNCHTSILSTQVTHALASGSIITVTYPTSTTISTAVQGYQVTGLATSSTLDKIATATGTSASPSSGNTATPTSQANELLFGAFTYHNQTGLTAGTGYSALATTNPSGGSRALSTEYESVSSTGTYAATGTITSVAWAAALATYKVNSGTAPSVSSVSSSTNSGTYGAGTVVPITITFSTVVQVFGTPQLALNAGGGAVASYASGSGTNTLTFNYTIASGQSASVLDYSSTSALALSGGYIYDQSGNAASLTLPATGSDGLAAKNIKVDSAAPTVSSLSVTPSPTNAARRSARAPATRAAATATSRQPSTSSTR